MTRPVELPPVTAAVLADRARLSGQGEGVALVPQPTSLADQIRDRLQPGSVVLGAPYRVPALWGTGDEVLGAQGEARMIVGPAGVGKTTLTGQLVRACLGLGDGTVLGWPIQRGCGRVLYLAMDRADQIRRRLRRQFPEDDRAVIDPQRRPAADRRAARRRWYRRHRWVDATCLPVEGVCGPWK